MKLLPQSHADKLARMPHGDHIYVLESAWKAGNIDALLRALIQCSNGEVSEAPYWVLHESFLLIRDLAFGNGRRSRGRTGNLVAQYRQSVVHQLRHADVEETLEHQKEDREQLKSLRAVEEPHADSLAAFQLGLKEFEARVAGIGRGKRAAFAAASRIRDGSFDAASQHTIQRSFHLVEGESQMALSINQHLLNFLGLDQLLKWNPKAGFMDLVTDGKTKRGVVARHYKSAALAADTMASDRARFPSASEPAAQKLSSSRGRKKNANREKLSPIEAAIRAGNILALLDYTAGRLEMMRITANVSEINAEPPRWLFDQLFRSIVSLLRPAPNKDRGRHANQRALHVDELKHFVRFQVLQVACGRQVRARVMAARAKRRGHVKAHGQWVAEQTRLGWSWRRAYLLAQDILAGTSWQSTPGEIRKSWERMKSEKSLYERFWIPVSRSHSMDIDKVWSPKMSKEYEELIVQILRG